VSASPFPDNACRSCGEELASGARFCSECGTLGDAVWRKDNAAQRRARQRLVELEEEGKSVEDELAELLAGAGERIRRARLPAQETLVATPDEPNPPE
jgi:ribosome-binding protein aMBF1 (putative translation factor)